MAASETVGGEVAEWLTAHGVGASSSSQTDIDMRYGTFSNAATPFIKVNMTCIVAVILFNDEGRVLMVQESKKECYGKWYLPAGRLECGETILDAARREVQEESGFKCQPEALLCVESQGCTWYRFTLTGSISGGRLKTLADSDRESLQAAWHRPEDVINGAVTLRCRDIVRLLRLGLESATDHRPSPPASLPLAVPHSRLLVRALLIFKKRFDAGDAVVLLSNRRGLLPVVEYAAICGQEIPAALDMLMKIAPDAASRFETVGKRTVAAVEFRSTSGGATDGLCLTVVETLLYDGDLPAIEGYSFVRPSVARPQFIDLSAVAERLPPLIAL